MRLIFMGTPEFAVPTLDAVIAAGHTVAAVYTQQDKPAGRGNRLTPPPVKVRALEHGVPVYQPASMRDPDVQAQIEEFAADAIIVVAYGKILPERVLNAARYGCINVHSSLLPKYRGAAPINWAVIKGEKRTGVTIMQLDAGVDTGDIFMQESIDIGENETAAELHDRLAQMGAGLLVRTLEAIENGTAVRISQDHSLADFYASMLDKSMAVIDWNESAETIHNLVRGLQPWPIAMTSIDGKRLKIYRTELCGRDEKAGNAGEVVSMETFVIACGSGTLRILELQGEGGKRMAASDYLRGHPVKPGTILG